MDHDSAWSLPCLSVHVSVSSKHIHFVKYEFENFSILDQEIWRRYRECHSCTHDNNSRIWSVRLSELNKIILTHYLKKSFSRNFLTISNIEEVLGIFNSQVDWIRNNSCWSVKLYLVVAVAGWVCVLLVSWPTTCGWGWGHSRLPGGVA